MGSGSGSSGQHAGRQVALVVRLFARRSVGKVGGEMNDGLESFGVEIAELCSVGIANTVPSREKAKQMVKVRDGIEGLNALSKVNYQVRSLRLRETERTAITTGSMHGARQIGARQYCCRKKPRSVVGKIRSHCFPEKEQMVLQA